MNRWLQQEPFVGQHETHYTYAVLSNRVPTNCVPKPQEINFVSVHSFHNKTGQTTIGQTTQHALNSSSPWPPFLTIYRTGAGSKTTH